MLILSYVIKIAVSTVLIYLTINIVERGNYRNTLQNALITAIILSLVSNLTIVFIVGLVIWIYILINWYSIGFFKSFLCVVVYAILVILLNIVLATFLLGGSLAYTKINDPERFDRIYRQFQRSFRSVAQKLPDTVQRKMGLKEQPSTTAQKPRREEVTIVFKNGRSITGRILMEGKTGYLVDIADGRSEVAIRKDLIDHIERPE